MSDTTAPLKMPKDLIAFFLLTFVMSVPPYILAALVPQEMVMLIGLIIALAPITAALILAYKKDRLDGAKRLLKRAFDRVKFARKIWYVPIFALMPVLFLLALGIVTLAREPLPDTLLPVVAAPVAFLLFLIFAFFEEIGCIFPLRGLVPIRMGTFL